MNFSVFSEFECKSRYERSSDKPYTLKVLAELTASTEDEMAEFLGVEIQSSGKINGTAAYKHYRAGKNDSQIAKSLGVSTAAVYRWRTNRGLPANSARCNRKIPNDDVMMAAYNRGLIDKEIAQEFSISPASVCRWRKQHGLELNKKENKHE